MKRIFIFSLCLFLFVVIFTACSTSEAGDIDTSGNTIEQNKENEYEDEITLLCVDGDDEGYLSYIDEAEKELNIKINVKTTSSNADNREAEISTILLLGDRSVDIITVNDELISEYKGKNCLEPISIDYVTSEIRSLYPQIYLHSIPMEGDELYSVPYFMDVMMYWVNQDLLDDAGIVNVQGLDDFNKLLSYDYPEGTYGYGGAWESTYAYNELFQFVNMIGGDYWDWSNKNTVLAMKMLHDMAEKHLTPESQVVDQYDQMMQKFLDGQYASIFMYSGDMYKFYNSGEYGDDYIHLQKLPDFGAKKTIVATWQYVINSASEHKTSAQRFMTYASSKEGEIRYCNAMHRLPARLDVVDEDLDIPDLSIMREYIKQCDLQPRVFSSNPMSSITEMGEAFQKYIADEIDLTDFCNCAQKIVDGCRAE